MKQLIIGILLLISISSIARDTTRVNMKERFNISPHLAKVQYTGNIGYVSFGPGYYWWRNNAQTDLLYGYVPAQVDDAAIHTFTLKNTFSLYKWDVRSKHQVSPILGFSVSFEPGQHSDLTLPSKYPDGYYSSNSFYACLNLGLKTYTPFKDTRRLSGIELFSEINTVADYLFYNIINQEDKSNLIYSIALGVNFVL